MIILGIDPGLANTGWGVIETRGSSCRARAYGAYAVRTVPCACQAFLDQLHQTVCHDLMS